MGHEALKRGGRAPLEGLQLVGQGRSERAVVDRRAVGETHAVVRFQACQAYLFGQGGASQAKEVVQQRRRGDDRGPGVKGIAVCLEPARPSSGLAVRLQHCHLYASGLQPDGRRQPAEAGADHHRLRPAHPAHNAATSLMPMAARASAGGNQRSVRSVM